jgi:hypothetical protein
LGRGPLEDQCRSVLFLRDRAAEGFDASCVAAAGLHVLSCKALRGTPLVLCAVVPCCVGCAVTMAHMLLHCGGSWGTSIMFWVDVSPAVHLNAMKGAPRGFIKECLAGNPIGRP